MAEFYQIMLRIYLQLASPYLIVVGVSGVLVVVVGAVRQSVGKICSVH